MSSWLWAPFIALQFLTRIPVTTIPDSAFDNDSGRRRALIFFPLVGVVVGAIGVLAWYAALRLRLPHLAAAICAVTATAWTTGAFHEDGLADTCDALGPHTREDALRVMRDSRIGTFGAVGLWAALTLKVSALTGMALSDVPVALLASHVLARWSSLPMARLLPYARDAKGLNAGIAALARGQEILLATIFAAICAVLLLGPMRAAACAAVTLMVIAATGLFYRNRFGGITGDCLGATNQIVEVAVLLTITSGLLT